MRRILSFLGALGFGCLVALVLAEVVLRVSGVWIGRHSDTMFAVIEHDAQIGWKMAPGVTREVDFVDVEGIVVRGNRDGFWDRDFDLEPAPGACRIAFLGDSFTWGMGVEEAVRFTNLIGTIPGLEALNFGMPGFGTDQALLTWAHVARGYAPDVVVLTVYENDYYDNVHEIRYGRSKPYFESAGSGKLVLRNAPVAATTFWDSGIYNRVAPAYAPLYDEPTQTRSRALHWLVKQSDLVRLVYRLTQSGDVSRRLERQLDGDTRKGSPPRDFASDGTTATPVSTAAHALESASITPLTPRRMQERTLVFSLIEALRDRVEGEGAQLIVAMAGKSHPAATADMEALRQVGIPVVDATTDSILPQLPSDTPVYFPYNQHWTAPAHRVVSTLIGGALEGACTPST